MLKGVLQRQALAFYAFTTLSFVQLPPILHQHLPHARYVEIVLFARRPVTPATAFFSTSMTGRANFGVKEELGLSIVQNLRKHSATRVKIKPTCTAMVHESRHVLLARVAVSSFIPWRLSQKLKLTFFVERMCYGGGR